MMCEVNRCEWRMLALVGRRESTGRAMPNELAGMQSKIFTFMVISIPPSEDPWLIIPGSLFAAQLFAAILFFYYSVPIILFTASNLAPNQRQIKIKR